jgi:hypothetical protein
MPKSLQEHNCESCAQLPKEDQLINSSALSLWMPEVHLRDQYVEEDDAGVQSEAIILHRHHGAL